MYKICRLAAHIVHTNVQSLVGVMSGSTIGEYDLKSTYHCTCTYVCTLAHTVQSDRSAAVACHCYIYELPVWLSVYQANTSVSLHALGYRKFGTKVNVSSSTVTRSLAHHHFMCTLIKNAPVYKLL